MTIRSMCLSGIGMMLLAASASAHGAEGGDMFRGNSLKPGAHSKGRTLTVAELDVCVGIENEIRSLKSTIDQTDLVAGVAESRYRGLEQVVNVKRQTLDNTDQREIDDFNKLVKEYGDEVDAYNRLVAPLNDTIAAHAARTERFNTQCAEIDYYESDLVKAYSIREKRIGAEIEREKAKKAGGR